MVESTHTSGQQTGFFPNLTEPFRTVGRKIAEWFSPASEAAHEPDAYEISVELPGVKRGDIEVDLHGNLLSIKGEKRLARETKERGFYFCERQYGAFQRSFRLPPDAEGDKAEAAFEDGVLTLRVPRRTATPDGARKIQIKGART